MKARIILLLFFALANADQDELYLARAIQGERPDLVSPSLDLASRVGQVVLNRLDAGWCSTIQSCVESGFWGAETILVPDQWALDLARDLLERREITKDFYVFSAGDCKMLGLDMNETTHAVENDEYGLYFFDRELEWE